MKYDFDGLSQGDKTIRTNYKNHSVYQAGVPLDYEIRLSGYYVGSCLNGSQEYHDIYIVLINLKSGQEAISLYSDRHCVSHVMKKFEKALATK